MLPVEDQTWAMDLFFFAIAKDLYNYYAFYELCKCWCWSTFHQDYLKSGDLFSAR